MVSRGTGEEGLLETPLVAEGASSVAILVYNVTVERRLDKSKGSG